MSDERKQNAPNVSDEQFAMADALLSVAPTPEFLTLKSEPIEADYIPLCVQLGKSPKNKNAVSIHWDHVSFMVPDWALASDAANFNLRTEQSEEPGYGKRLHVLGVTAAQVKSNAAFYAKALEVAKRESEKRQTVKSKRNHA